MLGGLFGAWAGRKVRDQAVRDRARAAEPEVFRAIDRFTAAMRSDFFCKLEQFREHLLKGVADRIKAQRSRFKAERKKTLSDLNTTKREREILLDELATDSAQLRKWLAAL